MILQPARLSGSAPFNAALFLRTFAHALCFPQREPSPLFLLFWAPFVVFMFRRRGQISFSTIVILTVGLWVLLQAAAMAYARPERGPVLANRYGDILTVGLVVNFACLMDWIRDRGPNADVGRKVLRIAGVAALLLWVGLVTLHARKDAAIFDRELKPMMLDLRAEHIERIREFYRTRNAVAISGAAYPHIPVVDAPSLVRDLAFPEIENLMAAELRNPIPLAFPSDSGARLANAVPVSLPNEPGALHRGTFFPQLGAGSVCDATSTPTHKNRERALLFKVAGKLQRGVTEIQILDHGGRVTATITDIDSPTLRPAIVAVNDDTFSVRVIDRSAEHWLAFLEPIEIGRWSVAALRLLSSGRSLIVGGWIALATVLAAAALDAFRTRRSGSIDAS
jgi:hypothetical protein